ncbi:MAG: hypothetical protein AAB884_02765 [Patescibacteria group bacterium]
MSVNGQKLGLALGIFAGLWHVVWSFLVAVGFAQPLVDWIFRLHFISPYHSVGEFSLGTALVLIIVTAVIGYIAGRVLGFIWNWVVRQ